MTERRLLLVRHGVTDWNREGRFQGHLDPPLGPDGIDEAELNTSFHRPLPDELGLEFLLRNGPLGDIIPVPLPFISNVAFADGHAETVDFTASYRRDENGQICGQDRTARLPWLWYIPQ